MFVLPTVVNISTLMWSISISFPLLVLWLLGVFVFASFFFFESHFFCAAFEVAQFFLKLHLCRSKQEHVVRQSQIREAIMVFVTKANTHSSLLLPVREVVL